MLQRIYEQMSDFYVSIEEEYSSVLDDHLTGNIFHFKIFDLLF